MAVREVFHDLAAEVLVKGREFKILQRRSSADGATHTVVLISDDPMPEGKVQVVVGKTTFYEP
jgi:hypothetical protein